MQGEVEFLSKYNVDRLISGCSWNCCPVAACHTKMREPHKADMMRGPSGENETEESEQVCRSKGSPNGWPIATSHNRIVESKEPDTMRVPAGENEVDTTPLSCPPIT